MSMQKILSHLARVIPGASVEIIVSKKPTFLKEAFYFQTAALNLSAMNVTFSEPDPENGVQSLQLLLAARISNGFDLSRSGPQMCIALTHDFVYPPVQASQPEIQNKG